VVLRSAKVAMARWSQPRRSGLSPPRWQPEGLREKRPVAPSCFPAFSAVPDDAKSVSRALHWVQRRSHAQSMTGIPEPCCAS
jgi:hypothetical protein